MNSKLYFSTENAVYQTFSFPPDLIYQILNNPHEISSSSLHKLYFSCKFFFPKLQIVPCSELNIMNYMIRTVYIPTTTNEDIYKPTPTIFTLDQLQTLPFKFYLTQKIIAQRSRIGPDIAAHNISKIIPFIHRSEITHLYIYHQQLTFKEYQFLSPTLQHITILYSYIKGSNERMVTPEEFLRVSPKLSRFLVIPPGSIDICTSETAQNIAAINHPQKIYQFHLRNVSANFNLKAYITFVEKVACNCNVIYFAEDVPNDVRKNFKLQFDQHFSDVESMEKIPKLYVR